MSDADDLDLEVDVAGIPMPWWLMSRPDQVTDVKWPLSDGSELIFTFESFVLATGTNAVHCTYPRYASLITTPDPEHECHWTHPVWDTDAMTEHSKTHIEDALTYVSGG